MQNINHVSAKYSLLRFKELYDRTLNLPNKIISDDDYILINSQDESKKKEFDNKRLNNLYDAQQITLEIRSLIKLIFGKESEYFKWVNKIYFTSEYLGFIMDSYNINHNKYWQTGKNELISIITNISNEETERMNYEKSLESKTVPFKYAVSIVVFIISTLAIWTIDDKLLSIFFDETKIIAVRVCFNLFFSSVIGAVIYKEYRKDLIIAASLTIVLTLVTLLKTDSPNFENNPSIHNKR